MWQRKTPEDKRCHRHILVPFRPTGKERYRNAADEGAIQVITVHRSWRGADYFRHIDKLAVGDEVRITNLWKTLTYTVADIQIIQPHEVDKIKIQQGRDLLTLLTCHPYASGGRQRFVVVCERAEVTQQQSLLTKSNTYWRDNL